MSENEFFGIRDVLQDIGRQITQSREDALRDTERLTAQFSDLEKEVRDHRIEITRIETKTSEQIAQLRTDFGTVQGLQEAIQTLQSDTRLIQAEIREFREDQKKTAELNAATEKERTKRVSIWAGVIGGAVSTIVTVITIIANASGATDIPVTPPPVSFAPVEYVEESEEVLDPTMIQQFGAGVGDLASDTIDAVSRELSEGSGNGVPDVDVAE